MSHDHEGIERWSRFKVWLFSLFTKDSERSEAAVEVMSLGPDDKVLDIGSGLGGILEHALKAGASVAGVDPSPTMVERATERVPGATVRLGSAEKIPFDDDEFTVVLTMASFHHWADTAAGLAEVARVLAPGGRFYIFERKLKRDRGHGLSLAGVDRLSEELATLGFVNTDCQDIRFEGRPCLVVSAAKGP